MDKVPAGRSQDDVREDDEWRELALLGDRGSGEITIRRLRAFWAIAHSDSLTRAAKLLGVAQPTLASATRTRWRVIVTTEKS